MVSLRLEDHGLRSPKGIPALSPPKTLRAQRIVEPLPINEATKDLNKSGFKSPYREWYSSQR